jgi:5'-3' exonuclease
LSVITALIDADLIAYRCAATCESDLDDTIVLGRCNDLVERIIDDVSATDFCLYLTGSTNFRTEIDPTYKAHRKDKPKPKWLQQCREFLVKEWNAKVTDGYEADDALAMAQREDTFICSLDKDMLQVPGLHYNWVKTEEEYITPEEGLKRFWTQMVVGDIADNVFGVRGLGPIKTAKLLDPIEYERVGEELAELDRNYYDLVLGLYGGDVCRLGNNAKLLWLLREEGGIWTKDHLVKTEVSTVVSLKPTSRKRSKDSDLELTMRQTS